MTGSVGTDLRHARERADLSLDDLSARTKIRPALLALIERDEFDRLPAGLLTRGFLRAYAREVGLDPESIVREYVAGFEPERLARVPAPPEPQDVEWDPVPAGRSRWTVLAPAIPLALAALFFLRMYRPVEVASLPAVAPVGTTGEQVELVVLQETVESVDRLQLEIHPTAPVWVEASADGARVLSELVGAGDTRTIEAAAEIALRIGDAAAFAYSINGHPGRTLGGPAKVRDIRITRDNHTEFLIE